MTYGDPSTDYVDGTPVGDRVCTCKRWNPYVPPATGYAFCGDCGGWLKRPAAQRLAKIADRRKRKRLAYRLAGLRFDGNPRTSRDTRKSVTTPQVRRGGKAGVGL